MHPAMLDSDNANIPDRSRVGRFYSTGMTGLAPSLPQDAGLGTAVSGGTPGPEWVNPVFLRQRFSASGQTVYARPYPELTGAGK
jgi:hypothetical protein